MGKILSVTLALVSLAFVPVSSQAAMVILDPGDSTIGIEGLEVLGTTYDVTFPQIAGQELYNAPSWDFTFDNPLDAGKATVAVIDALNGSTATRTTGPSLIWKIGYSLEERPGSDGDRSNATEGQSDGTVGSWLFGSAMLGLVGVARRKKAPRI